jgi:hypothetical protein
MLSAWMEILLLFICKFSVLASPGPKAKEKKKHTVKNIIFNDIIGMKLALVCISKAVSGGPQDFQTATAFIAKRDLGHGLIRVAPSFYPAAPFNVNEYHNQLSALEKS